MRWQPQLGHLRMLSATGHGRMLNIMQVEIQLRQGVFRARAAILALAALVKEGQLVAAAAAAARAPAWRTLMMTTGRRGRRIQALLSKANGIADDLSRGAILEALRVARSCDLHCVRVPAAERWRDLSRVPRTWA